MDKSKLYFIQHDLTPLLKNLPFDQAGKWGKMNAQQMVEHLADFFRVSTGKLSIPLVTPVDQLSKYKEFLLSDKLFRENTKAPMLPDEPFALRHSSMNEAIQALQYQINDFISFFEKSEENFTIQHPVFGDLNFTEWVLLHHKHVTHHARQFDLL